MVLKMQRKLLSFTISFKTFVCVERTVWQESTIPKLLQCLREHFPPLTNIMPC